MTANEGISDKELRDLIVENLRDAGIDPDMIQIKIKKGRNIVLRGEVDSKRERNRIIQTIAEMARVGDIKDELIILEGLHGEYLEEHTEYGYEDEIFDDDNECIGTNDVFRAMEDGMPYIPPTDSSFERSYEDRRRRGPRKKR